MHMRGTSNRLARGFVLPYVLSFAAMLAVIAMMLLESASSASRSTYSLQDKNAVFNAAEAGLNSALDDLDVSLLTSTNRTATMANGYTFTYKIHPNFTGLATLQIPDLLNPGGQLYVPIGGAIIDSTGTDPSGGRTTTVEAAVSVDTTQLTYPRLAIAGGLDIQGSYGSHAISDPSGTQSASLHANGNITASISGGVQGTSSASGSTNSLPPGTINSPAVPLPTVSQFDYMIASFKTQTQTFPGPTNIYVPAGASLANNYSCPGLGILIGCVLFYDGPLTLSHGVTFTGQWTMIVNGNLTETGSGFVAFLAKPNLVVVNGNAKFSGSSYVTGYVQSKGTTKFAGNGLFKGAIMSLGTVTFSVGGSTGGIVYDPSVIPPTHALTGLVKIVTYAEY
jgi:hypothetical protein